MTLMLPPAILEAIASCEARVTLIAGAGCSKEAPTSLPLSRELSREAHRQLVQNGVLATEACDDPEDLSKVAEAVWSSKGNQQELVRLLPRPRLRSALPNRGHLKAIALLEEGALADIITLNFDLAFSNAITQLGADIRIIPGPERHHDLGGANVIYLHRNVDCENFDQWILREQALGDAWGDDRWETVIVRRSAAVPVVVFAGLGSRTKVLERSVEQLRSAVANEVFLVEPGNVENSEFFGALGLEGHRHISATWVEFMDVLAERVADDQREALIRVCRDQAESDGWDLTQLPRVDSLLKEMDLLAIGYLRADMTLATAKYLSSSGVIPEHLADLLLAIELIAAGCGCTPVVKGFGLIEFFDEEDRRKGIIGFASGRGARTRVSLEAELDTFRDHRGVGDGVVRYVVSGVNDLEKAVTPPAHLVEEPSEDDLIAGPRGYNLVGAHALRSGQQQAESVFT